MSKNASTPTAEFTLSEQPVPVIVEGNKAAPKSKQKEPTPETSGDSENKEKEKPEYTEEELLAIFDDIIFSGEYSEQMKIKGRLPVTFRTRTAEQVNKITSKIDSTPANFISTVNERRSILNLYYALVSYQGKDLAEMKVEDREKFINTLPAPVIGALLMALEKFDKKVYKACEVGEENF